LVTTQAFALFAQLSQVGQSGEKNFNHWQLV